MEGSEQKLIYKLASDGPWKELGLEKEVLSISSPYLEALVHSSQESTFATEFSARKLSYW